MHNRRVSLRDVAAHLGLNESSVSRALGENPRISAATRRRVRAACTKLGYRPNSLITELATLRWQPTEAVKGITIAFIDRNRAGKREGIDFVAPLREQAEKLGYQLTAFRLEQFASSSKLQRILRNQGITDVILGPSFDESRIDLDWEKLICVQLLPGRLPLPLHSVVKNQFKGVVLAWQKAVEYGYKRIGITLLNHSIGLMDDVLRFSAATACQEQLFPRLPVLPVHQYNIEDHRFAEFKAWVKAVKPEVIIAFSGAHRIVYQDAFKKQIPYIALQSEGETLSGILADEFQGAMEAVNLLHFCRRTHQWGIPARRIDHVMEPMWFEGRTLPRKAK